jgi:CheY-like chemotaxis protein
VNDTEEASKRKKATKAKATFILKNGEEVSHLPKGYMKLAVTDSGAGMSEAQLAELFSDGVQFNVNELQAGQGSGLGLYIAKGIMEQHGGTLAASSAGLGKGTTFTMILPLYHVPEALREKQMNEEVYANTRRASLKSLSLRILVVDDSTTNRKLLARMLGNHGHICDQAENGEIAVGMADEAMKADKPYDSILMDYEMPVMNGPDACEKIRDLGCDAFIVGITGNVMEEDLVLFKSKGANGVLPKPFKLAELDQLWIEYDVS